METLRLGATSVFAIVALVGCAPENPDTIPLQAEPDTLVVDPEVRAQVFEAYLGFRSGHLDSNALFEKCRVVEELGVSELPEAHFDSLFVNPSAECPGGRTPLSPAFSWVALDTILVWADSALVRAGVAGPPGPCLESVRFIRSMPHGVHVASATQSDCGIW